MKKNIKISVAMILVLVLTLSVVSFAWFMENMNVRLSGGENMNITVGGDLEVAWHTADAKWGTEIRENVTDIAMLDCSGNGQSFYEGEIGLDGSIADGSMRELTLDNRGGSVLEIALDFRTSHKTDVYLGSLSSVAPIIDEYVDLTLAENQGVEHNNSISGGKFSADWIAAAARVAFLEVEYDDQDQIASEELKCIWIPNAGVKLEGTGSDAVLIQNSDIPLTYTYCSGVDAAGNPIESTFTYDPGSTSNPIVLAEGDQLCTADQGVDFSANQAPKILSFDKDGAMQVKHLVIRIWFEGYDPECTEVMLGGNVKYTFSFAGMLQKTALTEEQTAGFALSADNATSENEIYYTGDAQSGYRLQIPEALSGQLIYSTEGIDYSDYPADGDVAFGAGQTVYLRMKETADTYASDQIVSITFPASGD